MNKFDLKDRLDKALYAGWNIFSDLIFLFSFVEKKILKENAQFKGKHLGEKCFILGTGPSLATLSQDFISFLGKEKAIAVNSFYKSDLASIISPDYYSLMDDLFWKERSDTFSQVIEKFSSSPPVFITDLRAKPMVDCLRGGRGGIFLHSKKYPTNKVSLEVDDNIFVVMNVVSFSILTAMYMGFKKIYLLGCDYNSFCSAGSGHCYDDKNELKDNSYSLSYFLKFYWITTEFHYLISKLAKEKGIEIVNISEGSLLDAYPRKRVSDVYSN